jgi:hypothetical protein
MSTWLVRAAAALSVSVACAVVGAVPARAQIQMPDTKQISGQSLPDPALPAGTVSVRIVRGGFSNNIANQPVEFVIDGKTRTVTTDANGRAQVSGLTPGVSVHVSTTVKGERLDSQDFAAATTGIRVVLVATDPEAVARAAEDKRLAAGPAEKGIVVFGPQTRIVVEVAEDALNVFYVLDILNTSRMPVDIGGPLLMDLPSETRGAGMLEGSSPHAKVGGSHLIVTGPFAPGSTMAEVAFSLPFSGGTAYFEQRVPVALQQLMVLTQRLPGLEATSPQFTSHRDVTSETQPLVLSEGGAIAAGQVLHVDFAGLPHRPLWPRYLALTLAGIALAIGLRAGIVKRAPATAHASQARLRLEQDRLLHALVALERKHAAGRLTASVYTAEREALMASLERIYASLDTSAAA